MNFEFPGKVTDLQNQLQTFMDNHIYPSEKPYQDQIRQGDAGRFRP